MRVKRPAGIEQALGHAERLLRRDRQIVGDALFPGLAAGQRAPEGVAGPGVARPPGRVTVAGLAGHRSGSGSASQWHSSPVKRSDCSSCGKCPAPSISRHRYGAST